MSRNWIYLGLAAAGLAVAVALRPDSPPGGDRPRAEISSGEAAGASPASTRVESARPDTVEIAVLQRRLDEEVRARRELERRLQALEREFAALQDAARETADGPDVATGAEAVDTPAGGLSARDWFDEQALVAAGMDGARAYELRLFFEQLELERLRLRDRATREDWEASRTRAEFEVLEDREATLRERLGETEYAAYLYASGRSNRVEVSSVLASAPAGQAGIRAGDQILRYANERIYNPRELRAATAAGEVGELVAIEVERDGETLQYYLARGPMGIRTDSLSLAP